MTYGSSVYGGVAYGSVEDGADEEGVIRPLSIPSAEAFGSARILTPYSAMIIGDDPVRYYRFEETSGTSMADAMGNGNMTVIGGTPDFAQTGHDGYGIQWWVGDFATFVRPVQDDFSIEFWFKTTATGPGGSNFFNGWSIVQGERGGVVADFGVSHLGDHIGFGVGVTDTTIHSGTINDGVFHHVVATREKATGFIKLWVDGSLVDSDTGSTATLNAPDTLAIGGLDGGIVDEIAIYDYVLSSEQIANHFGTVDLTITTISIESEEAFGLATVTGGNVFITANSIPSEEAFGLATITVEEEPLTIEALSIDSAEAFGLATIIGPDQTIIAQSIPSAEAFGIPEITEGNVIIVVSDGIPSAEAFGNPIVIPGPVLIRPDSITSGEAFGSAILTTGNVTIIGLSIPSAEAFGSPEVQPGNVNLTPSSIASEEAFGLPSLSPGNVNIQAISIPSAEAFGQPDIIRALSNFDIIIQATGVTTVGQSIGIKSLDQNLSVIVMNGTSMVVDVLQGAVTDDGAQQDLGVG